MMNEDELENEPENTDVEADADIEETDTLDAEDAEAEDTEAEDDTSLTPAPTTLASAKETAAEQNINFDKNKIFLPRSAVVDQVANRFTLRLDTPLHQYDNDFCTAFEVIDNTHKDDNKYYAIIFERGVPIRLPVIDALKKRSVSYLCCPFAAEITSISSLNEQRAVVILPKQEGQTLSDFIAINGPCSEEFIIQYIITPLNILLRELNNKNVYHGNINADTITIDENYNIMLSECVSQLCGYSQDFLYESIERVSVMPIGKGEGDNIIDYYALGVLCLTLVMGAYPLQGDKESFLQTRFIRGSFNAITSNIKVPVVMQDLLKGLINDKKSDCWQYSQIHEWIKGKKFNIIAPTNHIEASRQITFNEKVFYNCRALAYEFYSNWDITKKFLKDEALIKWIERSVKDTKKAARLRDILKIYTNSHGKATMTEDDLVTNSLLILDPDGIIRFKDVSTHMDGLAQILAYGMAKKKKEYTQIFLKMLQAKLTSIWTQSRGQENKNNAQFNALWLIERTQGLIDENSVGFGIERCLYEVNPSLPCQSDLLFGDYITTLHDLLENLEAHAFQRKDLFVDRHITAFITSRLEMKTKVSIGSLSKFPSLENHNEIKLLALLALAQKNTKIKRLRNLTEVMEKRLIDVIKLYNSKTIREEISLKLKTLVKSGDLMAMLKVMSNPNYMQRDKNGFIIASNRYEELETRILKYDNKRLISGIGYRYGLQMAFMLAGLLCAIVIVTLIVKSM